LLRKPALASVKPVSSGNRFIDRLPRGERTRLLDRCQRVELDESQVLCEAGARIRHAYFPTSGTFISLITPVAEHAGLEVGMVGDEGLFGAVIGLGEAFSALRGLVQGKGVALRMTAGALRAELRSSPVLHARLDRYLCVLLRQATRSAGCACFHRVDQRLARWLLMTQDRAHSSHLRMTHEFLAYMMGVRRASVTEAATQLQDRGLITYRRGEVTVLDRAGLEAVACGCYQMDRDGLDELYS
jgi:CRP-like cAMP-binding protein